MLEEHKQLLEQATEDFLEELRNVNALMQDGDRVLVAPGDRLTRLMKLLEFIERLIELISRVTKPVVSAA